MGTGVLAHYYGTSVADGFFHNFSGWVVYVAALALLLAFTWACDRAGAVFSRAGEPEAEPLKVVSTVATPAPVTGAAGLK